MVDPAKQFPDIELDVMGYSDNVGKPQNNVKLSQAQADGVEACLVKKDVAAERISNKDFDAENPIADNATAEGRAKNRCMEIRCTLKEE